MAEPTVREAFDVQSQEDFNKGVVRSLTNLYVLTLQGDNMDTDINVRDHLAELDHFAFRDEYAQMAAGGMIPTHPDEGRGASYDG